MPDRWLAASLHRNAASPTMSSGWPTRPPGSLGGEPQGQRAPDTPRGPGNHDDLTYQRKVQAFAAAQRDGLLDDDLDPAHLVFLIIALAAWWQAVPQLARMLTGADGADPAEHTRRRACVVRAQRLALAPGSINPLPGSGHGR